MCQAAGTVGAVALTDGGALIAACEYGYAWLDEATGRLDTIGTASEQVPGMRMNDGKCDTRGRFLAGNMTLTRRPGAAKLFALDQALTIRTLLADLTLSNGLGWSPDGTRFYHIDTPARRLDVYDYDADEGYPSGRRVLADLRDTEGLPDGLTVDADGCIWVAMARGGAAVRRFSPEGAPLQVLRIPAAKVTSCTFGGPDLDELYITTACFGLDEVQLARQPHAGAVFRARPGVRGLPPNLFRTG